MNLTLIVYVITCLVVGLVPAFYSRYRFKSAWRFFWLGAATILVSSPVGGFVGSFVGGFIGGLIGGFNSAITGMPQKSSFEPGSPAFVVFVTVSTAIFEEAGRLLLAHRLFKRTASRLTLFNSLMCGAGFGGAENVLRGGAVATVAAVSTGRSFELSSIGADPYYPIGYAAIGIFHITMTVFAAHMLGASRFSPFLIFALLAIYHGAANGAAIIFTTVLFQPSWATAMWLLIAIVNSILALQIFRKSNSNPN